MAYAAVISLKHTIERLEYSTIYPQIKRSGWKLKSLKEVLRRLDDYRNRSINRSVINALDSQIREAVSKLEDAVEFYALYRSLPPPQGLGDEGFPRIDEKGVEQEIDSFLKTVEKLDVEYTRELDSPLPLEEDDDTDNFGGDESRMVGLSDQFEEITSELLDLKSGPKTVSLVGMAGIGKTRLAREIYQHPSILQHFDFRVWVSVGLKHQMKNIYVDILSQTERKPGNLYMGKDMFTLSTLLHNSLQGRRCLIVLDDIWSLHVCEFLKDWLPGEGNGRRLLLTTRLEEVVEHHSNIVHKIRFLNNEESWNLLWQNVFIVDKSFPPHLEKAGRKIAENCEGLPLLILAVAHILCGLDKTEEYWKKVADKKTTTFTDAYDQISKVLLSSYDYLPQHLKACFLYMGVFPQSSEIPVPKLIDLLTVEDFLESNQFPTLVDYMKKLVSNSLVIVCKQRYNYRIKSCKLHSAYWHLCVKEARKNKFFHVLNKLADASEDYIESQRCLSVQNNTLFGIKDVYDSIATTLTARSLLCTGPDHEYPVPICFNLMLLKVLDALSIRFYEFPAEVVRLLRLRYLALTQNGELPSSISKFRKLQCLILCQHHHINFLRNSKCMPKEIWHMGRLRHLRIMGNNLPDPSYGTELPSLSTLYVNARSCTKAVFRSIPNLNKLGIRIELQPDAAETLSCFEHIELLRGLKSLKCVVVNPRLRSQVVAPPDHLSNFPWSLKKLILNGLGYSWKYMSAIGSLPKLEVLKLRCSAFQGAEWETDDREFPSLEFLLLEDIDLVNWTMYNDKCFPRLQHLMIGHCYKLKEIPRQIGAIPAMKMIEVVDCSPSVVTSAHQIREEFSLQVVINSSWNFR